MRTKYKNPKTYRTGSILPLAVVMVVILFLIGMGLLELGFGARLNAIIGSQYISARAAADAGIAQALHDMNSPPWENSWSEDLSDSAYGRASYDYSIQTISSDSYRIRSTGTAGDGRAARTIYADVRRLSVYEYAIIVEDSLMFHEGVLIDGYNSADPTDPSTYLKIGTNSTLPGMITLHNHMVVDGDVLVGFGGEVATVIEELPVGGASTGPRYPLPSPVPLTRKPAPFGLPPGQSLVFDANGVATITQSGEYTNLTLEAGQTLQIDNPFQKVVLYISGDLWLKNAAQLVVTGIPGMPSTWSWADVYLGGDLKAGNSNGINNMTEKPGRFKLIGTGPDGAKWEIKNAGDFFGVFDAPNADLIIKQSGDIYGAVIGKSCDLRQAGNVYYDEDLRDPSAWPAGFGISRWWEE
jgi:hypothetical protein